MLIVVCLLVGAGAGLIALGVARARQLASDPTAYLLELNESGETDEFTATLAEPFLGRVVSPVARRLLGALGNLTPVARRNEMHHRLVLAGLDGRVRAEDVLALQLVGTLGGLVLGVLYAFYGGASRSMTLAVVLLLPAIGLLGPQSWVARRVKERQEAIFHDLPDILDLLAISVEAGVGFEGALDIVCARFTSPLALEFSRTLKEMELGLPRREALKNLKRRTEVPELSNFVLALVQADALGMPIGRVLHTQAEEMRNKRRQWAREKAAKLPVKILFPLILFIFPGVMIVAIGPAASSIGKTLH